MEELVVSREIRDGETVYSGVEIFSGREKTAAWALYYRAIWFPENRKGDLLKIIKDYPESKKAVELTEKVLQIGGN